MTMPMSTCGWLNNQAGAGHGECHISAIVSAFIICLLLPPDALCVIVHWLESRQELRPPSLSTDMKRVSQKSEAAVQRDFLQVGWESTINTMNDRLLTIFVTLTIVEFVNDS